jgi:hypothetical protein
LIIEADWIAPTEIPASWVPSSSVVDVNMPNPIVKEHSKKETLVACLLALPKHEREKTWHQWRLFSKKNWLNHEPNVWVTAGDLAVFHVVQYENSENNYENSVFHCVWEGRQSRPNCAIVICSTNRHNSK